MKNFNMRTEDMPPHMRVLLDTYPRDSWEANPGFKNATRQWLSAHQMFRQLSQVTREESERFLDKECSSESYGKRLARYGDALVRNLHGHHGWEDRVYFPELSAADSRFDEGLDVLEKDHAELDMVLDEFTRSANRVIKLIQLDEKAAYEETAAVLKDSATIEAFLKRHLSDEEDLAVPIILHHRLRG